MLIYTILGIMVIEINSELRKIQEICPILKPTRFFQSFKKVPFRQEIGAGKDITGAPKSPLDALFLPRKKPAVTPEKVDQNE